MQNIQGSFERMDELQEQMSTGKTVNRPSDDPMLMRQILKFGTSMRESEQYIRNIETGLGRLEATSSALDSVGEVLLDVIGLATAASSDSVESSERSLHATELNLMLDQLIQLANKTYQGKFLFGGVNTVSGACSFSTPFTAQLGANGLISGVVQNPKGINGLVSVPVAKNISEAINISGAIAFQPNGAKGELDIFQALITLRDNILNKESSDTISAGAEDVKQAYTNLINQESILGAQIHKLEVEKDWASETLLQDTAARSNIEDADYAELYTKYSLAEMLMSTTLQSTANLLQQSLLNFI